MLFSKEGLTPEQQRAISKLEIAIPMYDHLLVPYLPTVDRLCVSDNMLFIENHLSTSDIPRSKGWLWNQSRARQSKSDQSGDIELSFFKLNTRLAKHSKSTPPPCKLWVFNMKIGYSNNKVVSFVWCERGMDTNSIPHCDIDNIDIKDLAFLKPFIEEVYAEELGWM